MKERYVFLYRGFTLHCDPLPTADGRFGAGVTVADSPDGWHKGHVFKPLGYFGSREEAADCAFEFGKRWVDIHTPGIRARAGSWRLRS